MSVAQVQLSWEAPASSSSALKYKVKYEHTRLKPTPVCKDASKQHLCFDIAHRRQSESESFAAVDLQLIRRTYTVLLRHRTVPFAYRYATAASFWAGAGPEAHEIVDVGCRTNCVVDWLDPSTE